MSEHVRDYKHCVKKSPKLNILHIDFINTTDRCVCTSLVPINGKYFRSSKYTKNYS